MAWKHLTVDDLRKVLAQDEIDKLENLSLGDSVLSVLQQDMDLIADTWRGSFKAKGYTLDVRDHYIPDEYAYWVLVHARHAAWTRFPNSENIALGDARKSEYEKALELLETPIIGTSTPDYSGSELSSIALSSDEGASISVPPHRINHWFSLSSWC